MGRIRDITDRAHQHYMEERGRQIVTQYCSFCKWKVHGLLAETMVLAAEHRKDKHPEAYQQTKFPKRRSGSRTIGSKSLGENIALNRAQGAASWSSLEDTE